MKLNTQDMFTKVYKGLQAQSFQQSLRGGCVYRGVNGRKCAAGHILPDEVYRRDMEGDSCYSVSEFNDLVEDVYALRILQEIHDGFEGEQMQRQLINWAVGRGLKVPE